MKLFYSAHAKFNTISKLKWIDFQIKVNKHTQFSKYTRVKSIFFQLNFKSNENKIVKTFQLCFALRVFVSIKLLLMPVSIIMLYYCSYIIG